jgi:DNA-binding transcriptional ArsR family regulator
LINRSDEYSVAADQLTSTFAALADPTRRAILARPAGD